MYKMNENDLELRMYFFVPYNLSPIQQAIQAGHSALEYADRYGRAEQYLRFVRNWKTWVILNGGTTNTHRDLKGIVRGTLDQIGDALLEHEINFAYFQEPDLNDALTAVCFLADERVFNKEDYPDFIDYLIEKLGISDNATESIKLHVIPIDTLKETHFNFYYEWVEFMGGEKNVFLRELIKDKKLA